MKNRKIRFHRRFRRRSDSDLIESLAGNLSPVIYDCKGVIELTSIENFRFLWFFPPLARRQLLILRVPFLQTLRLVNGHAARSEISAAYVARDRPLLLILKPIVSRCLSPLPLTTLGTRIATFLFTTFTRGSSDRIDCREQSGSRRIYL